MNRTWLWAAALALTAGAAGAQSPADQIAAQLTAQGFDKVEVENEDGKIEVRARRGAQVVLLTYDATTGKLLDQREGRPGREGSGTGATSGDDQGNGAGMSEDDDSPEMGEDDDREDDQGDDASDDDSLDDDQGDDASDDDSSDDDQGDDASDDDSSDDDQGDDASDNDSSDDDQGDDASEDDGEDDSGDNDDGDDD